MKALYFTVTNELRYDQRMQRICRSLAAAGYQVTLVGFTRGTRPTLKEEPYRQKRIQLLFHHGFLMYAEYNLRLFCWLLFQRVDLLGAIDLDTIVPVYWASWLKGCKRIYDAHELFTEQKEILQRPRVKKFWDFIERTLVPKFPHGYTVAAHIAAVFDTKYQLRYHTIRNLPVLQDTPVRTRQTAPPLLLYFGAVNEARGFEALIPAMKTIHAELLICGNGNFFPRLQELIREYGVSDKVHCAGMQPPESFSQFTRNATLGICLYENTGLNHYYALPNKFFDYIQAGLPQVAMQYPEMEQINQQWPVALLLENLNAEQLSSELNNLLENAVLYTKLEKNCLEARLVYNWEQEEPKLLSFYKKLFEA